MPNSEDGGSKGKASNELIELKRQRGVLKGRLTIYKNYLSRLETPLSDMEMVEVRLRTQVASTVFQDFNDIQGSIECLVSEQDLSTQLEYRATFEEIYFHCMATSKLHIEDENGENSSKGEHEQPRTTNSIANVKLPQIQLPQFDGSYDKWLEFKNSYFTLNS